MKIIWNSGIALLIVTGALLGLTLPFGKLAVEAGVPPLLWSFIISFGAGSVLLVTLLASGRRMKLDRQSLRYFFIAAAISYAIPNLLMFTALPHLGAGYTGLMFTLSPVVTLVMSLSLRVSRPSRLGVAGIAIGFVGALLVASTRGQADRPADLLWIGVGLLIPVFLAAGNIYRTFDWPRASGPIELAIGSHLAAALILIVLTAATGQTASASLLADMPLLVLAQVAASSAMFAFFFRLQSVGGPVYLSQIGYVAAAVGLISGTLFLGESYGPLTWVGGLIILVGVTLTTKAQRGN